jgi:UDP-3-O-[3-hydroxymyristoyl] glucosamine N-acyltransferase
MRVSAGELAEILGGKVIGDQGRTVSRFAKIEEADEDSLCFIANPKYISFASDTKAAILLVSNTFPIDEGPFSSTLVMVEDPYASLAFLMNQFGEDKMNNQGKESPIFTGKDVQIADDTYIGAFAYLGDRVKVSSGAKIYPHTYLGEGVEIGEGSRIYPGARIYPGCKIGKNCIVHANAVIGSDGFGFAPTADGKYEKIRHTGIVVLEDDVEIGANATIDRATMGETVIRKGAKIDNLVQIAHNVEVGENTVIAAQAGVSGSTKLGKGCRIGGQAGLVGHIHLADGVAVNAQSGVSKSIEEKGKAVTGSPAYDFRQSLRHQSLVRKLPEIVERLEQLEQALKNSQK